MTISRRLRPALLLALLTAASCRVGGWNDEQVAAARGGTVELELADDDIRGELLAADDEAVLILVGASEILGARWDDLERFRVRDRPVDDVRDGTIPGPAHLREIQLASRYPFGLPDDQLAILLEGVGQDAVREVR
jgi:hypothetical protein